LFDSPGGKEKLAAQLYDALKNIGKLMLKHVRHSIWNILKLTVAGFIYVINFGLTQEEVDEQYEYAQEFFDTPLEEKSKYLADLDKGEYLGYKPYGLRDEKPGVPENTGTYKFPVA
jgi:hypothetical protein